MKHEFAQIGQLNLPALRSQLLQRKPACGRFGFVFVCAKRGKGQQTRLTAAVCEDRVDEVNVQCAKEGQNDNRPDEYGEIPTQHQTPMSKLNRNKHTKEQGTQVGRAARRPR